QGAIKFGELGLIVKQFVLAGATRHEQKDDVLGFGRMGRLFGRERVGSLSRRICRGCVIGGQKIRERHRTQTDAALFQEPPAGNEARIGTTEKPGLTVHFIPRLDWVRSNVRWTSRRSSERISETLFYHTSAGLA